jgi:hypothetical protein
MIAKAAHAGEQTPEAVPASPLAPPPRRPPGFTSVSKM